MELLDLVKMLEGDKPFHFARYGDGDHRGEANGPPGWSGQHNKR